MAEGVDLDQGFYRSATLVGFTAILMWSLLAALTVATGAIPPFQLAAVCFAIGGGLGLIWTGIRGELRLLTDQPLSVWLHGVGGIFGYHFFYFTALRHGSPAEVSLIAYLWPLLIVLFSAVLPGHRLKVHHVVGAVLGVRRCDCHCVWPGQGANPHRASRLSGCRCLRTHLVCLLGQQSNFFKSAYQSCDWFLPGQ